MVRNAILVLGAACLLACGAQEDGEVARREAAPPPPVEVDAAMLAVLERADAADGEADGVVRLCPGCALAMEGDPEHDLEVGEYHLHFCSDVCLDHFDDDTGENVMALADAELP